MGIETKDHAWLGRTTAMPIHLRHCRGFADFSLISDFLSRLYRPDNRDGMWFWPIWEYSYTHAWFDEAAAGRIGIWEEDGQIVAVASYELSLGEAFFNVDAAYAHLKEEMLAYAEENLAAEGKEGRRRLKVFVNDFDIDLEQQVVARGYQREPQSERPMSQFKITCPFPAIRVPEGFELKSLAEENDLRKVRRVFHRGFDHPGEVPEDDLDGIRKMQSGPHYRNDLCIVVAAPTGEFVSFGGIWYDAKNRFGYVEPVATDPGYRRRGLARAVVLEGMRRCAEEGATVAYVAAIKPLYLAMGFRRLYTQNCWLREWQGQRQP